MNNQLPRRTNGVEKVMDRLDLAAHLLVELNDRLLHAFDDRLRLN